MSIKNVSLKTIAAECGVSINTVSHALRDMDDISDKLKVKIRKKAIELGYMPNKVSQTMKTDEKPSVAVIINSFNNLYFNVLCMELMEYFRKQDEYEISIVYALSAALEIVTVKQCILQRVDLIVTHQMLKSETIEFAKLNNIRLISIGYENVLDIDYIMIDETLGCTIAAEYLSRFGNGGKYLYVGFDIFNSDYRGAGFERAIGERGGDDVLKFNFDDNVTELYALIDKGYRRIFFYNDQLAYDILYALEKLVPDIRRRYPDLHLIGFDGLCEYIHGLGQITTVEIDYKAFVREIYSLIKIRLDDPLLEPQNKVFPVSLHQRTDKDGII